MGGFMLNWKEYEEDLALNIPFHAAEISEECYVETVSRVLNILKKERKYQRFVPENAEIAEKRRHIRAILNERPPGGFSSDLLELIHSMLCYEKNQSIIVQPEHITPSPVDPRILCWTGDIIRLAADAVINYASPKLTGCFYPLHSCLDNRLHSAAGPQMREDGAALLAKSGRKSLPNSFVGVTRGYCLPQRYVFHLVLPPPKGDIREEGSFRTVRFTKNQMNSLGKGLKECFSIAAELGCETCAVCSIHDAFPGISMPFTEITGSWAEVVRRAVKASKLKQAVLATSSLEEGRLLRSLFLMP